MQRQILDLRRQVERISTWDSPGTGGGKQYATFVVAASDTTAAGKAGADYVCDGTADQAEIISALTDSTTSGQRRVLLLEGTYNLTAGVTVAANDVLEGQGWASELKLVSGAASTMNVVTLNNYSRVANIFINGNAITGTKYGVSATSKTGVQVEGMYIDDLNTRGIYLDSCVQSIVTRNLVTNTTSIGIQSLGGSNNNIIGNNCYRNQFGIYISVSGATRGEYINVIGNNCYRNTYQIYLDEVDYCTVDGNNCNGVLSTAGDYGIFIEESLYCTISDNTCNENSAAGIYLTFSDHNLIQGNICQGNSWSTSTNPAINTATGIRLDESDSNYITDNIVRQSLSGGSEIQQYGIYIDDANCDDNVVLNNDIRSGGNTNEFLDAGVGTIFRNIPTQSDKTIATGVITVEGLGYFKLVPETGTADDLDTINGGEHGEIITLAVRDSGDTITVKDGTGNLNLAGDFAMDTQTDTIMLICDATHGWMELSRSNNA